MIQQERGTDIKGESESEDNQGLTPAISAASYSMKHSQSSQITPGVNSYQINRRFNVHMYVSLFGEM